MSSGKETRFNEPVDALGRQVSRAMGLPILQDQIVLCDAVNFVDIFDLSVAKYVSRAFTTIAVRNLSAASTIELSFGGPFANTRMMVCGTQEYFVLDQMCFGPAVVDDTTGVLTTKVRARLGTAQGTQATGTINYSGSGQPTAGMNVVLDGITYQFVTSGNNVTGSLIPVAIAGTSDLTYTNLVTQINATDQAVRASVNTGTHILTLTSVAGGAAANAITIADGPTPTGATFSGATLTGAAGGVTPVFHIW